MESDLQTLALDRLAAHFGKPVGRAWLMNEIFPGKQAREVHRQFDALMREVTAAVPARGLVLVCASAPNGATTYALKARARR